MRMNKGGYGRGELFIHRLNDKDLTKVMEKDNLEDGTAVKAKEKAKGQSRAAIRREKQRKKLGKVKQVEPIIPEPVVVKEKKKQPKPKRKKQKPQPKQPEAQMDLNELYEKEQQRAFQYYLNTEECNKRCQEYESHPLQTPFITPTGLTITNTRIGQGAVPAQGQMITVRYRGFVGSQMFAKGILSSKFGTGESISGWDEGISTMRPGGVRVLLIPPELGYGSEGKGDKIPPNSTLRFHVELIRIGKRKRSTKEIEGVPLPNAFQLK